MTTYIYSWGNNEKRLTLQGRECRIITFGVMKSCMVEFLDNGQIEIVSRLALK